MIKIYWIGGDTNTILYKIGSILNKSKGKYIVRNNSYR